MSSTVMGGVPGMLGWDSLGIRKNLVCCFFDVL